MKKNTGCNPGCNTIILLLVVFFTVTVFLFSLYDFIHEYKYYNDISPCDFAGEKIQDFIAKRKTSPFMTQNRLENLYFKKAFSERYSDKYYEEFKNRYPNSPRL
jgi:hypothetical protein